MFKKLFVEWQVNSLKNLKRNFLSPKVLMLGLFIGALYAVKYALMFENINVHMDNIAKLDWVLAPCTFILLMIFTNEKNVTTYGIYLAASKAISIIIWVLAHDLHVLSKGVAFDGISFKSLLNGISDMLIVGTIIVEVVILPIFVAVAFGNVVEFGIMSRYKNTRALWYAVLILIEVAIAWSIFQYLLYPYFTTMATNVGTTVFTQEASALTGGANNAANISKAVGYIIPVLGFVFFPLLFMINNVKDSNLFLGRNQQLYIATQITFMMKNSSMHNSNPSLLIPIILIAWIGLKFFGFVCMSARVITINVKHFDDAKFIPLNLAYKKHRNTFFRHMYELEDKDKIKQKSK